MADKTSSTLACGGVGCTAKGGDVVAVVLAVMEAVDAATIVLLSLSLYL